MIFKKTFLLITQAYLLQKGGGNRFGFDISYIRGLISAIPMGLSD